MSRKYFGTDGVRGKVGELPITPEFVMHLGYAAGKVLAAADWHLAKGERPAVLIGKDTRISGYMLESALQAGLSAAGVDTLLAGPMPTPAVAYLTRALRLQAGIVISASHNPYDDNGIKFFSAEGLKLPDETERAIEASLSGQPIRTMPSDRLGKARRVGDAAGRYIEFCKSTFPYSLDLRGLRIVEDSAHGATYHIARHVFHELGADVMAIGVAPDGLNINDGCGAAAPAALRQAVLDHRADLGIAFDGDGDRVVMADAEGALYDGDLLLYVIAKHRQSVGNLNGGVVGTLMTNLAVEQALGELGIPFVRANVGDRYVLELMREKGWQSGGKLRTICLTSIRRVTESFLPEVSGLREAGHPEEGHSRRNSLSPDPHQCSGVQRFRLSWQRSGAGGAEGGPVQPGRERPRPAAQLRNRAGGAGDGGRGVQAKSPALGQGYRQRRGAGRRLTGVPYH